MHITKASMHESSKLSEITMNREVCWYVCGPMAMVWFTQGVGAQMHESPKLSDITVMHREVC